MGTPEHEWEACEAKLAAGEQQNYSAASTKAAYSACREVWERWGTAPAGAMAKINDFYRKAVVTQSDPEVVNEFYYQWRFINNFSPSDKQAIAEASVGIVNSATLYYPNFLETALKEDIIGVADLPAMCEAALAKYPHAKGYLVMFCSEFAERADFTSWTTLADDVAWIEQRLNDIASDRDFLAVTSYAGGACAFGSDCVVGGWTTSRVTVKCIDYSCPLHGWDAITEEGTVTVRGPNNITQSGGVVTNMSSGNWKIECKGNHDCSRTGWTVTNVKKSDQVYDITCHGYCFNDGYTVTTPSGETIECVCKAESCQKRGTTCF